MGTSDLGCSAGHFALAADLAAEDFADQVAGLPDLRQGQRTVDMAALAAGTHHSGSLQDGKVLGEIGLGDSQGLLQDGETLFSAAQQVEHLKTLGMGEGPANGGLLFEDFRVDVGA